MPADELPTYCTKCGCNLYACYDWLGIAAVLWCRQCPDVKFQRNFRGHAVTVLRQLLVLLEKTETATNMKQGAEQLAAQVQAYSALGVGLVIGDMKVSPDGSWSYTLPAGDVTSLARGGAMSSRGMALVGDGSSEYLALPAGATVMPASDLPKHLPPANVNVKVTIKVDTSGPLEALQRGLLRVKSLDQLEYEAKRFQFVEGARDADD